MKPAPIIYPVWGWFDGFARCLESVRRYSPATPIIVLGDADTARHMNCIPIEKYSRSAHRFAAAFQRHPSASLDFELRCFQRWFVLREYCQTQHIASAWSYDWDILVFYDLNRLTEEIGKPALVLPPQQFYASDVAILSPWLDFMMALFEFNLPVLQDFKALVDGKKWFSLNDFRMAEWFYQNTPQTNLRAPLNGAVSCGGLDKSSEMFEILNPDPENRYAYRTKRLEFRDGFPFAKLQDADVWLRLRTLHCPLSHKTRMAEYLALALGSKK